MSGHVEYALIAAALIALLIVLVYRLARRDTDIRVTRLGVFVERERYDSDEEEEQPADTQVLWPKQEER